MNRDEVKERVRKSIRCDRYLQKSSGGLYVCPFCGSGTGPHHSGALKWYKETNTWTCFAETDEKGKPRSGDVIDLHMNETGLDFNAALEALADELGLTIDPWKPTAQEDFREASLSFNGTGNADKGKPSERPQNAPEGPREAAGVEEHSRGSEEGAEALQEAETAPNYESYYWACRKRLTDPEATKYLEGRGISIKTARKYWIGFDPQADPAQSRHPAPRIIIPTGPGHYVGRAINPAEKFPKLNVKGSKPGLFNRAALWAQDVPAVFIVEGAFDALSVLEVGQQALALNSTNNAEKLIVNVEELQKKGTLTKAPLIICLDDDKAGQKATTVLRDGLTRLNVPFITADINAGHNDPNAALTGDRAAFLDAVWEAMRKAGKKPDNVTDYINLFMAADIDRFKAERKTGFSNLDAQAGGLYGGLYVLAAISSLGKTTLAAQLADQLAAGGNDVLFFSLEQSRLEMVSKSIARTVAQKAMKEKRPGDTVPSLSIRKGYMPQRVLDAAREYSAKVGDRLSIIEGNFSCDVSFIGDYVRKYARENEARPVVIVDYLQILQPPADAKKGQTTKETVDQTVTAMKRLSREMDIPVIVICSVNRANYLQPIDFESLKESGGIEYTADTVWGLQLQCLNEDLFDQEKKLKEKRQRIKEAKAERPRKIELVCLKNRYGISSYSCLFDYYPDCDLYVENLADEFTPVDTLPTLRAQSKKKRV